MIKHVLTVAAYIVTTFLVQGLSHFAIAKAHYAAIPFMRAEPVFALGFGAMLVQGSILSLLYERLARPGPTIANAVVSSWLMGAILVSYIVLAEAGKYAVPSLGSWIAVELTAAIIQFTLFGVLMGIIHRSKSANMQEAKRLNA